jgi:hypothetical protein
MTQSKPFLAATVVGAFLLASASLCACERSDPAQKLIDDAGQKLEAQALSGGNPSFADKNRTSTLNEVVSSLNSVLTDSDPGKSSAAAVLVSRAKSGLGEIKAKNAAEIEHQFVATSGETRALVDQWNSQHASALAASKFDPSKDLEELDKAIKAQSAEAAKREADKAAQERVVAEIQARSDSARAAAKRERDREASIRKSAEGQTQTAREDTIRKAVEASRAADALDKQASELAAEAAKEQPKVNEIASDIERTHAHADSLKKAKENIQQRAAAAKQQTVDATREADAVGKPITDSIGELAKLRDSATAPANEAAKRYEEAVSAVRKIASKESKAAASEAQGAAKQSLGDLLATKARSLDVYAATLEAIAKSSPPAPGAADAGKKAADVRAEFETVSKDAKTAYTDAIAAYKNAGGSEAIRKKLEDIGKSLEALNNPPPPPPPPVPAAAAETKPEVAKTEEMHADAKPAEPALTPEQSKAVEDEVRATLRELAAATAAGDTNKILSHILTKSDQEKEFLLAALPAGQAAKSLDAACKAKWGKDLAGLVQESKSPAIKANPMFMMLGSITGKGGPAGAGSPVMDADTAEKAAIKPVSLTDAEVTVPDAPAPTKFKKDGDTWKITGLDAMMGGGMGPQLMPVVKLVGDAFTAAAAGTTSGKYATADEMLTELSAKLMGAMNSLMGTSPGGPGRKPGGGQKPPSGGGG